MPERRKTRKAHRRGQDGYILLTLMLMVALTTIALLTMLPELSFQVKRDREEEMIHRGVQYSRAIKRYYKKFGRYPTRIEDLENTNNVRFLRRRYKDPVTGKDFKLLHFGQVPMGMGGVGMAGAMAMAGAAAAGGGPLGPRGGANSSMMGIVQAQAGMAAMSGMGAMQSTSNSPFGNSSFGNSSQPGTQPGAGSGSGDNGSGDNSGNNSQQKQGSSSDDKLSGQVFGGGPIIGVASASKAQSIREFASKNHYNDWNFVYDPSMDRGGLITGPAQPLQGLFGNGQQPGVAGAAPGTPGQSGLGQSGFGQSGFGQSGFGQGGFGQSGFGQSGSQPQPQPPPSNQPQ